jgi:hypothetical protein
LRLGQITRSKGQFGEIEIASADILHRKPRSVIITDEPGDLIIELVEIWSMGIAEDGPWNSVETLRHIETRGGKGIIKLVACSVYIKVAQSDEPVIPRVDVSSPCGEPICDCL